MQHVSKYGFLVTGNPPRLPKPEDYDTEVTPWADALLETIPEKLKLLMLREDEIVENREKKLKEINKWVLENDIDYWSEYFWTFMAFIYTEEQQRIQKWMKYWLSLYEIASKTRVLPEPEKIENGVSTDEIEMAKLHPIEDLIGGDVRYFGSRLMACCPFHEERTPSFTIFTNDNHFHCFGCGQHGDSIDFMMKLKKINLIEAVKDINRA